MKKTIVVALAVAVVAVTAHASLGQIVASWPSPADFPIAAARANNPAYFWLYCNTSPSFTQGPALAFAYFSEYLWLGSTTSYHRIFKIHCPATVSVAPSSVGKVKALFK